MIGIDAVTGKDLSGLDHLRQSIADILSTPIGVRVMRRDYGSRLFSLIDSPMTPELKVEIYAAVVDALAKWEPRIDVTAVSLDKTADASAGKMIVTIEGRYLMNGQAVRLEGIQI
jgi:phage baseplate assembly protein W